MDLNQKIYIAGHRGMVGSAIVRKLKKQGFKNLITRSHSELDLTNQQQVANFFMQERPDLVFLAAAKVGGIYANDTFPGEFIYENLMIQTNVIHQAFLSGTKKLLFLGSSCIYPKLASQPMNEEALLSGRLESTNEPYAIAKISGIKMCESYNRQYGISHGIDYRAVMPTNLYGPGDNYHPENSHVIPALIKRVHEAKVNNLEEVIVWGTGNSRREFLHVDDLASASVYIMKIDKIIYHANTKPMQSFLNVGYGEDLTIKQLAKLICKTIGYDGHIKFDSARPDGSPRKMIDSSRLNRIGWKALISLDIGLKETYFDFLKNHSLN